MNDSIVVCEKITKEYPIPGGEPLCILRDLDWEMKRGSLVSICGQSGCGKSTFMNILGLLDRQTSGKFYIGDTCFENIRDNAELASFRAKNIGFVFQQHHLLPEITAFENVMFAQQIRGENKTDAAKHSEGILKRLFTTEEISSGVFKRYPAQMSGGQCQRVAIARALVGNPPLVLADEPTGNLDENSANEVFELFLKLQKELGVSVVMVTHNPAQAWRADKTYTIQSQRIHENEGEDGKSC